MMPMGDVIPFKPPAKRKGAKARAKGQTLCRRGFHKWAVDTEQRFDVKQGRLVTVSRCTRCGVQRSELL